MADFRCRLTPIPLTPLMLYLILVAFVAALGGFLFGYDTAIISGTIGFVKTKFELDTVAEGWFVSSALVGCIWGVMFTGLINDWFGRKKALLLSGLLFLISAIGCMLAPTLSTLIIYRLIGGIGVGVASMTSPLFIAEISPPHLRGRLVTLYQLAITVGILLAYFANASLLELSTQSYETELFSWIIQDEVWRAMFGSECVPALLFFVLVLFIPESPRWLSLKKKDERAFGILARINGSEQAKQEMREIKDTIAHADVTETGDKEAAHHRGVSRISHSNLRGECDYLLRSAHPGRGRVCVIGCLGRSGHNRYRERRLHSYRDLEDRSIGAPSSADWRGIGHHVLTDYGGPAVLFRGHQWILAHGIYPHVYRQFRFLIWAGHLDAVVGDLSDQCAGNGDVDRHADLMDGHRVGRADRTLDVGDADPGRDVLDIFALLCAGALFGH